MIAALFLATAATALTGNVTVKLSDELTQVYREGYVWFVGLDGKPARRVTGTRTVFKVKTGRHVLRSYIRPCDGNCTVLDPPVNGCSNYVRTGQTATVHLRNDRCTLTFARTR
jgi:hypothetical protein